jgi:hypothetical protein
MASTPKDDRRDSIGGGRIVNRTELLKKSRKGGTMSGGAWRRRFGGIDLERTFLTNCPQVIFFTNLTLCQPRSCGRFSDRSCEFIGGAWGMTCHVLKWNHDPTIVESEAMVAAKRSFSVLPNGEQVRKPSASPLPLDTGTPVTMHSHNT